VTAEWPRAALSTLLRQVSRPENVDPSREYRMLGARWYAGGLFKKDIQTGQSIKAARVYRVQRGDFIYNRLFAWKGSFAVADEESQGCYVSNEFPCFEVESSRLDARYLLHYFMQVPSWNKALGLSSGATPTSRNRLKEKQFLEMSIPLPPVFEQRRLVDWVESIAARTDGARELRAEAEKEADVLCRSILSHASTVEHVPMRSIVEMRPNDVVVQEAEIYQFAGVYSFGRGVFRSVRKTGSEFAYQRLTRVHAGDFIYPKLMAWEGALGMVPEKCDGYVVSPEFPVFAVDTSKVLPDVLDVHFRTPSVWPDIAALSTGTNVRRRRLHPNAFLRYSFPLPDMDCQRRLVQVRNALNRASGVGQSLRVELDALLPAALDKAFSRKI
jgi:type I restriction enzyme S subunit